MKHWEHHPEPIDGCFGCKGLSLQMNTGDATRDIPEAKSAALIIPLGISSDVKGAFVGFLPTKAI